MMLDLSDLHINGTPCPMIRIPKGSFTFGKGKPYATIITFKKDFYIGQFPVTQALWKAVMGTENNPSYFKGDDHPVESIRWNDINEKGGFLDRINQLEEIKKFSGIKITLPSEAMWEYAAKGARDSDFEFAGGHRLSEVGWYEQNSYDETKPVGLKLPNELDLYDMSGNVWEWCADYHSWSNEMKSMPVDGSAWINDNKNTRRVVRGGSWSDGLYGCRVSSRDWLDAGVGNNALGFRFSAIYL